MKHVIQKQQFLLFVRQGIDAFQVQHAASRFLRERLIPLLERIFDELSGEGEVIQLDHLSIDLGVIAEAALQKGVIDEAIYRLMKAEVIKAIEKELSERPTARTGTRESVLAKWWYFMEHGRLPWNADRLTETDHRQVLELLSIEYAAISRLRASLARDALFGMRMVAQHGSGFLENIVAALTSARQEGLGLMVAQAARVHRLIEHEYRRISAGGVVGVARMEPGSPVDLLRVWAVRMSGFLIAAEHEKRSIIWRRVLAAAATRPAEFAAKGAAAVLLRDIPNAFLVLEMVLADEEVTAVETPLLRVLRTKTSGGGKKKARRKKSADGERAERGLRASVDAAGEDGRGATEDKGERSVGDKPVSPDAGRKIEDQPREGEAPVSEKVLRDDEVVFQEEEIDEEGVYVPNAGVILVHPFLSTLFQRAGFWDGGGFRDLASRQKAILLLHFLATGERRPPEYALVFPKMLCGYAVEMPMPGELELDEEQYDEGLVMLENVVQRWEKLGNSSVDGLREAFLQREGKLSNRGGRLVLRLETSGIDVLLDYLPWNIGMVKLPWLKSLLYVEWR